MVAVNLTDLPNPYTPSAFLPPEFAYQTDISRYILVGGLAALIWDILTNLSSDYKLLVKHTVQLPSLVYFFSRIATLYYCLASTIFETAAVGHCYIFDKMVDMGFPLSIGSTSLLFFFRVRAIFSRRPFVVWFFFFLWLCVLGANITVPFGVTGGPLGPTRYCLNIGVEPYTSSSIIVQLVHDTCVFLAISWRLLVGSYVDYSKHSVVGTVKATFTGKSLPAFSKALFQDGQLYYLITVFSNLLTIIMVYVDLPPTYRSMFTVPNMMLCNSMACLVFRKAKLGMIRSDASLSIAGTTQGLRSMTFADPFANRSEQSESHHPDSEEFRDYSSTKSIAL